MVSRDAVLFGAVAHDLGKTVCPEEPTGPGIKHEIVGPGRLEQHRAPRNLARFSGAHGPPVDLEDAIVAWSDHAWRRSTAIDAVVAEKRNEITGLAEGEAWVVVDDVASGHLLPEFVVGRAEFFQIVDSLAQPTDLLLAGVGLDQTGQLASFEQAPFEASGLEEAAKWGLRVHVPTVQRIEQGGFAKPEGIAKAVHRR